MADGSTQQTWAARLTPIGTSALATVALRGPDAWNVARSLFRGRSATSNSPVAHGVAELPALPEVGRFWLGRFGDQWSDEVVLAVVCRDPTPWLEIHCHGSEEWIRVLLEMLAQRGVRIVAWQDLDRETEAISRARNRAKQELAATTTVRTAGILLDQFRGAFDAKMDRVLKSLDQSNFEQAHRLVGELLQHSEVGRHLNQPWKVAVVGPPNVGKSSLLNALAGFQRSVVSAIPGTTRDRVTTIIAVDGWPVELTDTAGLRSAMDTLESAGIERARDVIADADLCLWVYDGSLPRVEPDFTHRHLRLVVNKIDLPAAWEVVGNESMVAVSARNSIGIDQLCQRMAAWLVPDPPLAGAAVPFTIEQIDGLQQLQVLIEQTDAAEAKRLLHAILHR